MKNRKERINNPSFQISCVVPCHNEAENIISFLRTLQPTLKNISNNVEIIIVDDGCTDNTSSLAIHESNIDSVKLIRLSRNFGKELAITAGLEHSTGDVTVIIDADFQHPIDLIPVFIAKWVEGFDMVYAVRETREDESLLKRTFTKFFYRINELMAEVKIPPNAGDFRLLDKKAVAAINTCNERVRFMKGLYAWVGFKSIAIPFQVQPRQKGTSSWRFAKLLELAITGITSFSSIPLRFWGIVGFIVSFASITYGICIIIDTLLFGVDVPGYSTIVTAIMFFGGIQLLSIGIIGEYVGRIFNEVKDRPKYIIEEKIGFDNDKSI